MSNHRPKRAPAFRCPEHGWVTVDRLNSSACHQEIFRANFDRLRSVEWTDTTWDEALQITSHAEADLLGALRFYGMTPDIQYPIGPYFADFCFTNERYVVEVDGRRWHKAERDKHRDDELRRLGYVTQRFRGADVWDDPVNCARRVRDGLEATRRKMQRQAA